MKRKPYKSSDKFRTDHGYRLSFTPMPVPKVVKDGIRAQSADAMALYKEVMAS